MEDEKNDLSPNTTKEPGFEESNGFTAENAGYTKPPSNLEPSKSTPKNPKLTLEVLRQFVLLKYGSYREFGRELGGYTYDTAYNILNGFTLPKTPKVYERIAKVLGLRPIAIYELFTRLRIQKELEAQQSSSPSSPPSSDRTPQVPAPTLKDDPDPA